MSMTVPGAGGPTPPIMTGASTSGPPQQKMTSLYNNIDTAGAGSITKDQLQTAFQTLKPPKVFQNAGVDQVFAALDPQGSGAVSRDDFIKGMKGLMASLRAGA